VLHPFFKDLSFRLRRSLFSQLHFSDNMSGHQSKSSYSDEADAAEIKKAIATGAAAKPSASSQASMSN